MPRKDKNQRLGTASVPKLEGKTALEKLQQLSSMKYEHQAKWFLNAYWAKKPLSFSSDDKAKETLFQFFKFFCKLDPDGSKGCDLHQQKAHMFLEKQTGAHTWIELKAKMKKLDADHNLRLSLAEFLIHEYKLDLSYVTTVAANVDPKHAAKLAACQKKLTEAEEAMEEADKAKAESVMLLARIKSFEKDLQDEIDRLQAIVDDESISNVKRMKAKHEMMDVKNGSRAKRKGISKRDPDFLNKANIDQKAAVRRQKAAAKLCKQRLNEAAKEFEELNKVKGVGGEGTIWFMGRELEEMKKFCSQAEFKRRKKKLKSVTSKMRDVKV